MIKRYFTLASCLCATPFIVHAQPSFMTLGSLPGGNGVSHALQISSDGSTISGLSVTGGLPFTDSTAFRWTASSGLEALPRISSGDNYETLGVSPSGNHVVGSFSQTNGDGRMAFVWSEQLGTVAAGTLPGGSNESILQAIADDGTAVGFASVGSTSTGADRNVAAIWTPSKGLRALPMPTPGDTDLSSSAFDILADGRIYGASASGKWLYSENAGFEYLKDARFMNYINSDATFMTGTVIVPGNPVPLRPAYWTPQSGTVELAPLTDGAFGGTFGMSDDGSVIIGAHDNTFVVWLDQGDPIPFVDYAESFGIDLDGWSIISLRDVSNDGTTFIGTARFRDWEIGRVEAYVLIIPAPGVLVIPALACLTARRRR